MRAYIVRRLLLILPTLFILTILVFLSVRFLPGDVIDVMVGRMEYQMPGEIDREAVERRLGLARIHRFIQVDGVRTAEGCEGVTGAIIRA